MKKQYLLASLLVVGMVQASDSQLFSNQLSQTGSNNNVDTFFSPQDESQLTAEGKELRDDVVNEARSELTQVLQSFGISAVAATALLHNSFGRVALAGFLGYKSFKNAKKAFQETTDRKVRVAKAVSYAVVAAMLANDGYQWLLSQNKSN